MRARDAVGRTIVAIKQERFWNEHTQRFDVAIHHIELDNGTLLLPNAFETNDAPTCELLVWKPKKGLNR